MADKISPEEREAFFKKLDDFIAAYSAQTIEDYEDDEEESPDTSRSSRAEKREDAQEGTSTEFTHFSRGTSERKTIEGRQSRSTTVPKRRSTSLCQKPVSDPRTGCTYMLVKGHMPSWKGMCKHCGEFINMDSHMFFMKCSTGNPEDEMFFTKVLGTDQFPSAGVRNPRDSTPVPWSKSEERDSKASEAKSPAPTEEVEVQEDISTKEDTTTKEESSTVQEEASTTTEAKDEPVSTDVEPCEAASMECEEADDPDSENQSLVELLYDRNTGAVTVRDGLREVNVRQPRRRNGD